MKNVPLGDGFFCHEDAKTERSAKGFEPRLPGRAIRAGRHGDREGHRAMTACITLLFILSNSINFLACHLECSEKWATYRLRCRVKPGMTGKCDYNSSV